MMAASKPTFQNILGHGVGFEPTLEKIPMIHSHLPVTNSGNRAMLIPKRIFRGLRESSLSGQMDSNHHRRLGMHNLKYLSTTTIFRCNSVKS